VSEAYDDASTDEVVLGLPPPELVSVSDCDVVQLVSFEDHLVCLAHQQLQSVVSVEQLF